MPTPLGGRTAPSVAAAESATNIIFTWSPDTERRTMTTSSRRYRHPQASPLLALRRRAFAQQLTHATMMSPGLARRGQVPNLDQSATTEKTKRTPEPPASTRVVAHTTKIESHHRHEVTGRRANHVALPQHSCPSNYQPPASRCTDHGRRSKRGLLSPLDRHHPQSLDQQQYSRGINTCASTQSQWPGGAGEVQIRDYQRPRCTRS